MKKELDELLCKRYPKIFRDRHAPMTETCMCWGFDINDGWFNIIDKMCRNMQWHIDQSRKTRLRALRYNRAVKKAMQGEYEPLIKYYTFGSSSQSREWAQKSVDRDIENGLKFHGVPEVCPQVIATQVKEKFGTLRFYYYGGDDYCRGVEALADSLSAVTCEDCGSPGRLLTQGWHRTLCETHAKEQNYDWNIEEEDEDQISE
jgi:hypothetical protein